MTLPDLSSLALPESPERAHVYNRVITILNRERDRAKGWDKRATKKRAEIRGLIEWLANDPAFEIERWRRLSGSSRGEE